MTTSTHQCPGPECKREISFEMLACQRHWFQVPKAVRTAVYRAWDYGDGLGSEEHARAVHEAISYMRP